MYEHKKRYPHHHKKDGASIFKQKSLAAIKRKKVIEKVLKIGMVVLAIIMAVAVVYVYTYG